jgi:hypothetical protein
MYLIHMYLIYLIYGHNCFPFVAISIRYTVITPVCVTVCVCNSFILQVNPNIIATKRKICYEYRFFFNNSWVDLYFFVENKGKLLYLICQKIKFFLKTNFFQ